MNENALSKTVVSMILIMSIMMTFMVMPINAIATETLIIGGTIAAFLASCGVTLTAPNANPQGLATILYDLWRDREAEWNAMTDTEFISLIGTKNNQLILENKLSKELSRFAEEVQAQSIGNGVQIDGSNIMLPIYDINTSFIKYAPNITTQSTITTPLGTYTLQWVTISSYRKPYYILYRENGTYLVLNGKKTPWTEQQYERSTEDKAMLCFVKQENGRYALATVTTRGTSSEYGINRLASTLYALPEDFVPEGVELGIVNTIPSATIEDDQSTIIDINVPFTDIESMAENALTKTIEGTLSATYTNKITAPPVPETDMGWIKGFHSIWEYVERMVNSVSEGMKFIPNMLKAMPPEVSIFIYGGFVLLLFGGVISKLLQ